MGSGGAQAVPGWRGRRAAEADLVVVAGGAQVEGGAGGGGAEVVAEAEVVAVEAPLAVLPPAAAFVCSIHLHRDLWRRRRRRLFEVSRHDGDSGSSRGVGGGGPG